MQTYTGIFFFITLLIYHGSETVLDFILYMLIPLAIYYVLYIYNKQDEEFKNSIYKQVNKNVFNIERIEKTKWMEKLWEWAEINNIGSNRLPKTPIGLVTLEILDLSHKEINELPSEIGKLVNLKYMDLSHNNLTNLPESMDQLLSLSTLKLSHNLFNHTPKLLARLPNITKLTLENNKIKKQSSEIEAFNFLAGDIAHRLAGVAIEDEDNLLNRASEGAYKKGLPYPNEIPNFPTNDLITS